MEANWRLSRLIVLSSFALSRLALAAAIVLAILEALGIFHHLWIVIGVALAVPAAELSAAYTFRLAHRLRVRRRHKDRRASTLTDERGK